MVWYAYFSLVGQIVGWKKREKIKKKSTWRYIPIYHLQFGGRTSRTGWKAAEYEWKKQCRFGDEYIVGEHWIQHKQTHTIHRPQWRIAEVSFIMVLVTMVRLYIARFLISKYETGFSILNYFEMYENGAFFNEILSRNIVVDVLLRFSLQRNQDLANYFLKWIIVFNSCFFFNYFTMLVGIHLQLKLINRSISLRWYIPKN